MKMLHLLFALLVLLYVTACDDPLDPDLPAATQKGANTLGFKVDGKNWVPYYRGIHFSNDSELSVNYNAETNYYSFSARRETDNVDQSIEIGIMNVLSANAYYDSLESFRIQFYDFNKEDFLYTLDENTSGHFNITQLDTINQIVSGTFSFTFENAVGERLQITDGRFDYHYPIPNIN